MAAVCRGSSGEGETMRVIDGTNEKSEVLEAMRMLVRHVEEFEVYEEAQARVTRARYLGLIKAGFSESQALELCRDD